jgi:hypothetical protein
LLFIEEWPDLTNKLLFIITSRLSYPNQERIITPGDVLGFTEKLSKWLRRQKLSIESWGEECLRWAFGCGVVETATRAAFLFSAVMNPFYNTTISAVLYSIYSIVSLPPCAASRLYVAAMLRVLNASVDAYGSRKAFAQTLPQLFTVAKPFLSFPQYPELSSAALRIIARYIMRAQITDDEFSELLPKLAVLLVTLHPKKMIDGAFLALFATQQIRTYGLLVVLLYFPRIYSAVAALNNISPYSEAFSNDDIKQVIQASRLMLGSNSVPENFCDLLEMLEEINPDDMVMTFGLQLLTDYKDVVVAAAPILCKMAAQADTVDLSAIFRVIVGLMTDFPDPLQAVSLFACLAPVAARDDLPESMFFLKLCGRLATQSTQLPQDDWAQKFVVQSEQADWKALPKALRGIASRRPTELPTGDSELDDFIELAPTVSELWNHAKTRDIRQKLAAIRVKPFTEIAAGIDRAKQAALKERPGIVVDTAERFLGYLNPEYRKQAEK